MVWQWEEAEASSITHTKKYMYASTSLYTQSVTHTVKNLSAMQENWVHSLGLEDPLENGMATHSRIPGTEEFGMLQSMGWQKSQIQLSK